MARSADSSCVVITHHDLSMRTLASPRVDSLVGNFPNRLETKLEMSLSLRRELNNLIKHDTSTVDQVRDKLLSMPNLSRKSWGHKCESPLIVAVAASRLDLVDMMVRECGVDVNSYDKKILSGHVTRPTTALLYAISCYDGSSAVSVPMIKLLIRLNSDVKIEGWSFLFRDRWTYGNAFDVASSKPALVKLLQQSARQNHRAKSNRKSNEDATAIFELRVRDIGVMESHLMVTEQLMTKTKNKIQEVNSIKAWLCKERDRPGGHLNEQDVETFIEGVEKIRAHVDNLKRQEESSFKISPYRKDLLRGPIMAFKSQLECCICMDMSKRGGGIFSCQSDHLICDECVRHVEDLSCPVCREEFTGKTPSRNFLAEKVIHALNILRTDINSSIGVFPPKLMVENRDQNINKESDGFTGRQDNSINRLQGKSNENTEFEDNNNDNSEMVHVLDPVTNNEAPLGSNEIDSTGSLRAEEKTFETEVEVYQNRVLDSQTDIVAPEGVNTEESSKVEEDHEVKPDIQLNSELKPESEIIL